MAAMALCCEINIVAFSMSEPDFFYYIHCIVVVLGEVFKILLYGNFHTKEAKGSQVIIFHNFYEGAKN